jgi:hypothetical protein
VVELHARGAAERPDRKLDIEAPVADPEIVQVTERLAGGSASKTLVSRT